MRLGCLGIIMVLLIVTIVFAQQTTDVLVEGISDGERGTQQQDRDEALLDAKLKAIERAGVSIEAVTRMENFKLKSDWVEAQAKGVILPGFQILDQGYGADGLYHIVLSGKVSKSGEALEQSEGDRKYRMAILYSESDKLKALEMMQEVVDNYGSCASADDALYYIITESAFDENDADDMLIRMKAYYPSSSYVEEAERWINKKKEETRREEEAAKRELINSFNFVHVPGGTFMMGALRSEDGSGSDEYPQHRVTVQPFYIMVSEVTQAQWKAVMGSNPSYFKEDNLPVENVSWNDCQEFIEKLYKIDPVAEYKLPSEAEWEYACRANTRTRFCSGNREIDLVRVGWFSGNSHNKTHPVGSLEPNLWGLYDMHGNVWEWCEDWYHDSYKGAPQTGKAWETGEGTYRVMRGGSWYSYGGYCRSASRDWYKPETRNGYVGFRLVRTK
jgi:formylglycine-generating enzyme required for sulfatase activity